MKELEEITIEPTSVKLSSAIVLLEEKVCRVYDITLDELRTKTIKIKNGELTI